MFPRRATFPWPLTIDGDGDDGDGNGNGAAGGAAADTFNDGADGDGKAAGGKPDGGDGAAADDSAKGLRAEISKQTGDGDSSGEGGDGAADGDGTDVSGDKGDQKPTALTFEKRPEWLPEQFHDAKSGEVKVEDMAKAWTGMRAKVSTGDHKAPKDASTYKLEIPENMASVVDAVIGLKGEDGKEGPILEWFRGAAHEAGLPQDVVDALFSGYLEQIAATLPEPMDTKAELAKLGPKGQEVLDGMSTWLNGLKDKGIVNVEQHAELDLNLDTATGVSALVALRSYYEGFQVPDMLVSKATGSVSADELRAEQAEVMKLAAKGDPTAERKARDLEKKYEKLYGTEPAGSSARPAI